MRHEADHRACLHTEKGRPQGCQWRRSYIARQLHRQRLEQIPEALGVLLGPRRSVNRVQRSGRRHGQARGVGHDELGGEGQLGVLLGNRRLDRLGRAGDGLDDLARQLPIHRARRLQELEESIEDTVFH